MRNWTDDNLSWKFALLLCAAVWILYYFLFLERARVDVVVEVEQATWFKIYWAGDTQEFSETRMEKVRVNPGQDSYVFYLKNIKDIENLRVDSHEYAGAAVVTSLHIRQKGYKDIILDSAESFAHLVPNFDIASSGMIDGKFTVHSTGQDPNFILPLSEKERSEYGLLEEILRLAVLCCIVILIYQATHNLAADYSYVPVCLAVALALAATMAIISKKNGHPDEFVHVAAVEYYKNNWLPPAVDNESIQESYSPYGVSRLHTNEIYYLIAGKFAKVAEPFFINNYMPCRMFNVFLLLIILLYTTQVAEARIMALPLILSPQIWYLYSYCNSDGFSLAVAFFAACQLMLPNSMLNRFLVGMIRFSWMLRGCVAGTVLGLLFLLKNNYLPFTAFMLFIAGMTFLRLPGKEAKVSFLKRTAILLFIGLALFGGKKVADYSVNGSSRQALISEARTAHADPMYSPESKLDQKHGSLYMKERGVTLSQVIFQYRWFEKTFRSAFGVYGYFQYSATEAFYSIIRWSGVLVFAYFFGTIIIRGDTVGRISALIALCLSAALIAASLNHSWSSDFQPQGRYLFPIVGILVILCGQNRNILSSRWLSLLTVWMFFLSLYSFMSVALFQMVRGTVI
jgi:hypothetical protein